MCGVSAHVWSANRVWLLSDDVTTTTTLNKSTKAKACLIIFVYFFRYLQFVICVNLRCQRSHHIIIISYLAKLTLFYESLHLQTDPNTNTDKVLETESIFNKACGARSSSKLVCLAVGARTLNWNNKNKLVYFYLAVLICNPKKKKTVKRREAESRFIIIINIYVCEEEAKIKKKKKRSPKTRLAFRVTLPAAVWFV